MKITIEIPDDTILATVSLARQNKAFQVSLGTFHICTADLVDGGTVDFTKYPIEESEDTE